MKNFIHNHVSLGYDDLKCVTKETGRKYYTPDGKPYPSMTTVLSHGKDMSGIEDWKKRVGQEEADKILRQAGIRGTQVHQVCENYLNNIKNPAKGYMPHIYLSFQKLKPYIDRIDNVLGLELALYSHHLKVAGRSDVIAHFDGIRSIIDFKTSRSKKQRSWITDYFLQEAGYAICFEERTGLPITQLVTIMDIDNDFPEIYIEHRDDWAPKLLKRIEKYYE